MADEQLVTLLAHAGMSGPDAAALLARWETSGPGGDTSGFVTIDTDQEITGVKAFLESVTISGPGDENRAVEVFRGDAGDYDNEYAGLYPGQLDIGSVSLTSNGSNTSQLSMSAHWYGSGTDHSVGGTLYFNANGGSPYFEFTDDVLVSGALRTEDTLTVHDGALYLDASDLTENDAPEIHLLGHSGHWFQGIDFVNTVKSRDFVLIGLDSEYAFDDGVTVSGSPTLTSAAQGGFHSRMVGRPISGAGIPNGTTVTAVASATSLTMSANATASASGVRVHTERLAGGADDIFYITHRGARYPVLSLGLGQLDGSYAFAMQPDPTEYAMGGLYVRNPRPNQTGKPFTVADGNEHLSVNADFHLTGADNWTGGTVVIRCDTGKTQTLAFVNAAKTFDIYGFSFTGTNDRDMKFSHLAGYTFLTYVKNGGDPILEINGQLAHKNTKAGFFNTAPVSRPTGVAVTAAGVHAALVTLGLIAA